MSENKEVENLEKKGVSGKKSENPSASPPFACRFHRQKTKLRNLFSRKFLLT